MSPAEVRDPGADYGEVFTRRWVAELILDLVRYTPDVDLASTVLVEPSCGTGAFLGPIVDRLIESAHRHNRDLRSLAGCIRAFDLFDSNAEIARKAATTRLQEAGVPPLEAEALARGWVTTGDFLLTGAHAGGADFVVGNPPYVRLEAIPRFVMDSYRRACRTMRGRSDIYIGFIERGLDLLKPSGTLGYICADRWMRNNYGADLREMVGGSYAVDTVITMHDVDAFENEVSAYPAIVILKNAAQGKANVVHAKGDFSENEAEQIVRWTREPHGRANHSQKFEASRFTQWFRGRDLWPSGSPLQLALLADIESRFPALQDPATGTRVGIGIATGCDDVFITTDPGAVEPSRLLPLLLASDAADGTPAWGGRYLVNPWEDGRLVDLEQYPRLKKHFDAHAARLGARHVATKHPSQWYRTIDRVDPSLLARPKLVIPDLKSTSHPVLDEGRTYPHHNLYFVVSEGWDLEVLGGLLLSDIANLFVGAYCVKMRGGCYRFQAQYLRRIRVPDPTDVPKRTQVALAKAFRERDREAATAAAATCYGVDAVAIRAAVR